MICRNLVTPVLLPSKQASKIRLVGPWYLFSAPIRSTFVLQIHSSTRKKIKNWNPPVQVLPCHSMRRQRHFCQFTHQKEHCWTHFQQKVPCPRKPLITPRPSFHPSTVMTNLPTANRRFRHSSANGTRSESRGCPSPINALIVFF